MARVVALDTDLLAADLVGGSFIQCACLDREQTPPAPFQTGTEDASRPSSAMHCRDRDPWPFRLPACASAAIPPLLRSFPRRSSVGWMFPVACEQDYGPRLRTRSEPDARGKERRGGDHHPNATAQRILLTIVGLVAALAIFGLNVKTTLAGLGIGGLAIALAAQKIA
jgi:hypothetical protein